MCGLSSWIYSSHIESHRVSRKAVRRGVGCYIWSSRSRVSLLVIRDRNGISVWHARYTPPSDLRYAQWVYTSKVDLWPRRLSYSLCGWVMASGDDISMPRGDRGLRGWSAPRWLAQCPLGRGMFSYFPARSTLPYFHTPFMTSPEHTSPQLSASLPLSTKHIAFKNYASFIETAIFFP